MKVVEMIRRRIGVVANRFIDRRAQPSDIEPQQPKTLRDDETSLQKCSISVLLNIALALSANHPFCLQGDDCHLIHAKPVGQNYVSVLAYIRFQLKHRRRASSETKRTRR